MKKPVFIILTLLLASAFTFGCQKTSSTEDRTSQNSQEKKDIDLIKAVKNKAKAKVKDLLESGANPNTFYQLDKNSSFHKTVLGNAVDEKQLEIARLLLEHGANVDKNSFDTDENGKEYSVGLNFEQAVENQDAPMMKLLIDFRADLDKDTDSLPLIFLTKTKEVLALLVENGFDINQTDSDGYTRLMRASYENDLDLVKDILQNNPELDIVSKPLRYYNDEKLTALGLARNSKYTDKNEIAKQKEIITLLKKAGAKK